MYAVHTHFDDPTSYYTLVFARNAADAERAADALECDENPLFGVNIERLSLEQCLTLIGYDAATRGNKSPLPYLVYFADYCTDDLREFVNAMLYRLFVDYRMAGNLRELQRRADDILITREIVVKCEPEPLSPTREVYRAFERLDDGALFPLYVSGFSLDSLKTIIRDGNPARRYSFVTA